MQVRGYGSVLVTVCDRDKDEVLPLVRRFYQLGFNILATEGTARFLKAHGIRTHAVKKISDGSDEIPDAIRQGYIAYVINTRDINSTNEATDGAQIRALATENGVSLFTALDTVRILLDVLEETTITVSLIND